MRIKTRTCIQCGRELPLKLFRRYDRDSFRKQCPSCRAGRVQPGKFSETFEQRLTRRMSVNPKTGCWDWLGSVNERGYGQVCFDYRQYVAHRAAWLVWRGEVPKTKQVLHKCDNKLCINIKHLYVGTDQDNARDRMERDRLGRDRETGRFEKVMP